METQSKLQTPEKEEFVLLSREEQISFLSKKIEIVLKQCEENLKRLKNQNTQVLGQNNLSPSH